MLVGHGHRDRSRATTTSSSSTGARCPIPAPAPSQTGSRGPSRDRRPGSSRGGRGGPASRSTTSSSTSSMSARSRVRHLRRCRRAPRELRELGVTAIEVMPIATFPGNRNWGYDGVYTSAPHPAYGGPAGFSAARRRRPRRGPRRDPRRRLQPHRSRARRRSPPSGRTSPIVTRPPGATRSTTAQRGVREWAIQNAELWMRDYRRRRAAPRRDARDLSTTAIRTSSSSSPSACGRSTPRALVIAEMETGDLRPIEEWAHDAQWADEFHHALHVLLTGEHEGYYADYEPSVADLAARSSARPPERLVFCSQNHDQVGNRALGDRPSADELRIARRRAAARAADTAALHGRGVRRAAPVPVLHRPHRPRDRRGDPRGKAARVRAASPPSAARKSRTRRIPRPSTARSSTPRTAIPSSAFYRRLLELRRDLPRGVEVEADEEAGTLRLRRGGAELHLNFPARSASVGRDCNARTCS